MITGLDAMNQQNATMARLLYIKVDSIIVIVSYLLGSIPFGYLVARMGGVDIRKQGSGNVGATNVMRVMGKGPGYTVFVCDALKGLAAVIAANHIAAHYSMMLSQTHNVYLGSTLTIVHDTFVARLPDGIGPVSAAIACIIGHNFPVWLGFKGGKGMATSLGVLLGMIPLSALICLGLWVAVFFSTRYVSLASIAASIALPVVTLMLMLMGEIHGWPYFYFTVAACLLAIWRHRENIVRLANGTENRFVKKPKEAPPQ